MAHNYTPVALYHATIAVPDDGDPAIAASVNSPLEDVADGLAYIAGPFAGGGTVVLGGSVTLSGTAMVFDIDDTSFGGNAIFGANPGNTFTVNSTAAFASNTSLGSSAADTIQVNGTLGVIGNASFGINGGNQLNVISSATFSNNVTFNGAVESAGTLEVTGTLEVDGTAVFTGNVQIGDATADSLEVYSTTLFRSSVTIGNDAGTELLTVNAPTTFEDTVDFNANVEIGSSGTELNVNAPTLFRSNVTLGNGSSDDITVIGSCDIQNLSEPMGFTGVGRVPRKTALAGNEDVTLEPGEANTVYFTAITADRVATIGTGAVSGDQFYIFLSKDSTNNMTLTINDEDGDRIVELVSLSGEDAWCWIALFPDGEWRMLLQNNALA
jgi:hypothetical protein